MDQFLRSINPSRDKPWTTIENCLLTNKNTTTKNFAIYRGSSYHVFVNVHFIWYIVIFITSFL